MVNYAFIKNKIVENILVFEETNFELLEQVKEDFSYDESVECLVDLSINVGDTYHNGHFLTPRPYPSWELGEDFWVPPVPMPTDDKVYTWDETTVSWVEVQ